MECCIGTAFEAMVGENILIAGQKEKQLATEQQNYQNGVPAIKVMVDAGWSKCSHKHSYSANWHCSSLPKSKKVLVVVGTVSIQ